MTEITICTMEANNGGVSMSGVVERVDGVLIVVVNSARLARVQRLSEAIHELAHQVRRGLPAGHSSDWGVAVACLSGGFSFGYGNRRGGGSAGPAPTFKPCVQRMIASYPEHGGLGAALEHAERALADCCT